MPELRGILVPEGLEGERVDAALARMFGLTRTLAADLATEGAVTVERRTVHKGHRISAGDWLEVALPDPREAPGPAYQPDGHPQVELPVVFEDDDIVVVDKPPGVAAHASVGWTGPNVLAALAAGGRRISTSGIHERQGIVHRLDAGTSGVMTVAKSELAYTALKQAFRDRAVDKTYHALVQGLPDPVVGTIDAPIRRHPGHDYKFAVMAGGRHSVTHYQVLEAFRATSLVEVRLETGRTHQIRVHLAAVRHPCAGDPLYGGDPVLAARLGLERQWLHAVELRFDHPRTGERVRFESPYAADLQLALDRLTA
ncbi:MAG TPA: RluA family pseudouridine synthase [Dermatophilaceae bacterium]|nr:RluA family pseudouridine synthase [Dermatophilaceae bacterium]